MEDKNTETTAGAWFPDQNFTGDHILIAFGDENAAKRIGTGFAMSDAENYA